GQPVGKRQQIRRPGAEGAHLLLDGALRGGEAHAADHRPLLHIQAGTALIPHVHRAPPWLYVDSHPRERETGGGGGGRTTPGPRVLPAGERARAGRHSPLLDAPRSAGLSGSWAPPLCRPPARRPPPDLCHGSVPFSSPPLPRRGISRGLQWHVYDV